MTDEPTAYVKRIPERPHMWGCYIDDTLISDHRLYDGAANSARAHNTRPSCRGAVR